MGLTKKNSNKLGPPKMPGITANGDKGKAPKGSSSKKGLDKGKPGLNLAGLHAAGHTKENFQSERLAKLEETAPKQPRTK
jgi:hypothetical protein